MDMRWTKHLTTIRDVISEIGDASTTLATAR